MIKQLALVLAIILGLSIFIVAEAQRLSVLGSNPAQDYNTYLNETRYVKFEEGAKSPNKVDWGYIEDEPENDWDSENSVDREPDSDSDCVARVQRCKTNQADCQFFADDC